MKFALLGKNIAHSLSAILHKLIAQMNGYRIDYEIVDIEEVELKTYIDKLKQQHYHGFNITTPYKEAIIAYLDYMTPQALKIGACNTVVVKEGKLFGYNTDYDGFLKMIERHNPPKVDAYILGSGGASRAVYHALKDNDFNVFVVSRHADNLPFEKVLTYEDYYRIKSIPLLINATPVGSMSLPGSPILDMQTIDYVIDLIYNPLNTPLMQQANKAINGLEMLIYQAIKAQSLWQNQTLLEDDQTIEKIKGALYEHIWKTI